jgi:SpoVK/Ycf46/Vps4 family AAA+-type ATPase
VLEHAGIPHRIVGGGAPWVPHTRVSKTGPSSTDWTGMVAVGSDEDQVIVCRKAFLKGFHGLEYVVMLAAKSRTRLEWLLVQCHEAWKKWRREREPTRTSRDRHITVPRVSWSDLCLSERLMNDLRLSIEGFAAARELYLALGIPYRRGVLLYGPPGNGKSMTCRAIVSELNWPTIVFTGGGRDEVAGDLFDAFALASTLSPCVLLFEDVDSLFESEQGLSAFLNELDGVEPREGILVVATTNHPEKLDAALTSRPSRFDQLFELPDPGRRERERYLTLLFGQRLEASDIVELVDPTEGMSMAFLKELFVTACTRALTRGESAPAIEDVRQALEQLSQHRRSAKNEFSKSRPTGFGPRNTGAY